MSRDPYEFKDVEITHKDGVPWIDAPAPPRVHDHWVQTNGWIGFHQYQRCPCGAMRTNLVQRWERNGEPRVAPSLVAEVVTEVVAEAKRWWRR